MLINWKKYNIQINTSRIVGNVKVFCPQCHNHRHDKSDKSLSCNLATGEFLCHYCGFSGCAVEYSEEEKQQWVKEQNWYKPPKTPKKAFKKPQPIKHTTLSKNLLKWAEKRKISANSLQLLKVTEGKEWMPQVQKERNTIQFNYFHNGELVNVKYRDGNKNFKLVSGAELLPYNIDAIKNTKECIITEGEMDALSFVECGRLDVISVPNGANSNLSYLDDYIEEYFDNKETIYIAVDTDTKGVILRDELLRRFGNERCRILDYGNDCKDANEVLIKHGKNALLECLHNAPECKVDGVFMLSDFEQSLDALFEVGMQRGYTIGHPNFDKLCSFETKRLCIVTGVPSSGKSEFIDEIAERLNIIYQWKFAFFSPENAPLAYHASKIIEKLTGRKFSSRHLQIEDYIEAKKHVENNFFFISPTDNFQIDNILDKAKFLVRKRGIKGLVIDPYNRLENQQGSMSETQYVSIVLDKLTNFAQVNDVLVILMAHPRKMQKNEAGGYDLPSLYDISGSANFFNKADFGITIHRDRINDVVQVHVQKVKFRHLGENGVAIFKYNINNGRYVEYEDGVETIFDNSNHLNGKINEPKENNNIIVYDNAIDDNLPF